MPFTGDDLIDVAEIYTNITIDDNDAVLIINQGLNRLATLGYAYSKEDFTIADGDIGSFQSFTDDVIGVVLVLDSNENLYNRWKFNSSNGIEFDDEGDYEVIIKIIPSEIDDVSEDISINDIYKTPLFKYLTAFTKLQRNDTSPDGTRLMQEFERLGASAYNTLIQANIPSEARVGQNV